MPAATSRVRAHLDLRQNPGVITWNADRSGIEIRLSARGADVTLDLGHEAIAQLKQALGWAGTAPSAAPRLRVYQPAA